MTTTGPPVWLHRVAVGSTTVVALGSAVLAFRGTASVAEASGAVPPGFGWIMPLVIEPGVLAAGASALARAAAGERPRIEVGMMSFLLVLSTIVQVAHSASLGGSLLGRALAGVVPAVLLTSIELIMRAQRRAHDARAVVTAQMLADARREQERAARAAQRAETMTHAVRVQSPAPRTVKRAADVSNPRHGVVVASEDKHSSQLPHETPFRVSATTADPRDAAADLIAVHGNSLTGAMVALALGKSESRGRRILAAVRRSA